MVETSSTRAQAPQADIGVIGGSGFYSFLDDVTEISLETPYGRPSDSVFLGEIAGRRVAFLPRHGRKHHLPPHRINYRANVWALRSLGVRQHATLNNVNVETHNNGGQSNPIMVWFQSSLTLTNSKLAGFNTSEGNVHGINSCCGDMPAGNITIRNSTIEGSSPWSVQGIYLQGYRASIVNTTITMNVGSGSATAIRTGDDEVTIENSQFISDGTVYYNCGSGYTKVANTCLPGGPGCFSVSTNNYDENFNPMPNQ